MGQITTYTGKKFNPLEPKIGIELNYEVQLFEGVEKTYLELFEKYH